MRYLQRSYFTVSGLGVLAMAMAPRAADAAELWLWAGETTLAMPDGAEIPMWGFALEPDGDFSTLEGTVTVPGPTLTVPPGDTSLTIHLYNDGLPESISVVIPGLVAPLSPARFTDAQGRQRVRSFTTETSAGTVQTYSWTDVPPGTYLYESGTHPAVKVQMGLYGGLHHDAAAGQAYPGIPYTTEITLFYSEIDPALHAAVQDGTYGTTAYPSTLDYHPKYFLINGVPYTAGAVPMPAGDVQDTLLVRLLNAGLESHVPTVLDGHLQLVAEDGTPYRFSKELYGALLPAGKTIDALYSPGRPGTYAVVDRAMHLTNNGTSDGGMLTFLSIGSAEGAPVGTEDFYALDEGGTLSVPAPGVLGNDVEPDGMALSAVLDVGPRHGTLDLQPDGAFTYTPVAGFDGVDGFTYRASDGGLESASTPVMLLVNPVNTPPTAQDDAYAVEEGTTLQVPAPGVLGNDADPDGDALTAILEAAPTNGTLTLQTSGAFTYSPTAGSGTDTFRYSASDGVGTSNEATVTLTILPMTNEAPVAADDTAQTSRNTPVSIDVLANDHDPDGTLDPATIQVTGAPRRGTAVPNPDGTVTYTPNNNFRGTDAFRYTVNDSGGATSNAADVRVNVTR